MVQDTSKENELGKKMSRHVKLSRRKSTILPKENYDGFPKKVCYFEAHETLSF